MGIYKVRTWFKGELGKYNKIKELLDNAQKFSFLCFKI